MTNAAKNPPEEEGNEIESPTDGPTPDWMRLATSVGSGSSLTEDNTPAWLKSVKAGKGFAKESQPTSEPPAAQTSSDDSMSDLERLLAEEGINLSTVTEERPKGSENMSSRDWLIATSSEEIIRNKLETKPVGEKAPPTPVVKPQTPSSPPPAEPGDKASHPVEDDDSMSDLERLLAEEGINLSTVTEERPKGSENMSSRDWLIATSSEEIIRNKLEAKPVVDETQAPIPTPQPPPLLSNDKMVVEEDLPDWLRDIAEETSAPSLAFDNLTTAMPEGDQFVIKEELPEWLQEIAEDTTAASAPPVVSQVESVAPLPGDDKMVVEEDLPDWLQEIADEAPVIEEPDLTSVIKPPDFSGDKIVVEEDLPDWLREAEAETPVTTEKEPAEADLLSEPSFSTPEADKLIVEEDLPEWLQEVANEPPITSDSLPTSADQDQIIVEEDLPDWLREDSTEEAPISEELTLPASVGADTEVAEDLPEWLRELEGSNVPPDSDIDKADMTFASTTLDMIDSDEDLPDWLREVESGEAADDLLGATFETPAEPSFELKPETVALSSEDILDFEEEEEELPDWLKEVQKGEGEGKVEPDTPIAATFTSDLVVEEELPDWLKETSEETEPSTLEEQPGIVEQIEEISFEGEELPDWLQEIQLDVEEPFEPSEPSPEPFAEVETEKLVIEEELPDWLQETSTELPVESAVEPSPTELLQDAERKPLREMETLSPAVTESSLTNELEMVDEAGLSDWLQDVGEEVVGEEAVIEEAIEAKVSPLSTQAAAPTGIPNWLQKLREVQVEEKPITPSRVPIATVATSLEPVLTPTPATPQPEVSPDAEERLQQARAARDKGDIEEALRLYDTLVSSSILLDKVIGDLQQTLKSHPNHYLLYQMMGDAMMRDGRLQSALKAYREALVKLR